MAILLAIGVMNLYAMAIVAVAISIERLSPAPAWPVRTIGLAGIGTALWMIWQAAGPV
jgi:predicted metal-binding membrane protein